MAPEGGNVCIYCKHVVSGKIYDEITQVVSIDMQLNAEANPEPEHPDGCEIGFSSLATKAFTSDIPEALTEGGNWETMYTKADYVVCDYEGAMTYKIVDDAGTEVSHNIVRIKPNGDIEHNKDVKFSGSLKIKQTSVANPLTNSTESESFTVQHNCGQMVLGTNLETKFHWLKYKAFPATTGYTSVAK